MCSSDLADAGDDALVKRWPRARLRVLRHQRRLHRQQVVRVESEIDGVEVGERSQHQAGGDEQHQCGRNLQNDQAVAKRPASSASIAAGMLLEHLRGGRVRRLQRRPEAEQHASRDTIAKSLEGTWRADLLFVLQQQVTMYDAYLQRIEE